MQASYLPLKKALFFFILAPMVLRVNEIIMQQRAVVAMLQQKKIWTDDDNEKIATIAKEFHMTTPEDSNDMNVFAKLLRRVDVVSASLAMTQATIESGWGTSRFAAEGMHYLVNGPGTTTP